MALPLVIAGAAAVGSAYLKKRAGDKARDAQNEATDRADQYNREAYELGKDKLRADHAHMVETIDIKKRNEIASANYLDSVNLQKWNYDLMIRNSEQQSLNDQFVKADQLYNEHINLNEQTARTAIDAERVRLEEIQNEIAFQNQDLIIEALMKEGAARARGVSGRSAEKAIQSELAAYGRNEAILAESLLSGVRDVNTTLKQIGQDKQSANLAAFANKMLKPGQLPVRPMPLKTPVAQFQYPRAIQEFDFGPAPVGGYKAPDTGWLQFGASVLGSASSITSAAYAGGQFE